MSFLVGSSCQAPYSKVGEKSVDGRCLRVRTLLEGPDALHHLGADVVAHEVVVIDDPLHPLYNKGDRSWNGEWEYAVHVDRANKRWTAEVRIPFATLGAGAPKAGDIWGMNVGREHYAGTNFRGSTKRELSLWSPNLESRSFQAPEAFGDLIFE